MLWFLTTQARIEIHGGEVSVPGEERKRESSFYNSAGSANVCDHENVESQ